MKKMQIGDYVDVKDIPDQATLDRIRESVKQTGYHISEVYGRYYSDIETYNYKFLTLDMDGDLLFVMHPQKGYLYTPAQIVTMVDTKDVPDQYTLDCIRMTIKKLEQEILAVKEVLNVKEDSNETYQRGDRFYIDGGTTEYILAAIDMGASGDNDIRMGLISLRDGNRWNYPVKCNSFTLSKEEMDRIVGGHYRYQKIDR